MSEKENKKRKIADDETPNPKRKKSPGPEVIEIDMDELEINKTDSEKDTKEKESAPTQTKKDDKNMSREEKNEAKLKAKEKKEAERKAREEKKEADRKAREEKEAERKAKEAKKEAERKAKEAERKAKEAKKEAERKAKEAERKAKEAEREQKRQEKKNAEKAKQQEEEARNLVIKRQSDALMKFLKKVEVDTPKTWGWSNDRFHPFHMKNNMIIAPHLRRKALTNEEKAKILQLQMETPSDYLQSVKHCKLVRRPYNPMRAKLFQFQDSVRPPYYGTFRKKSKVITGRHPFRMSPEEVDYDVDSEAEWEEEQAGADDCLSDTNSVANNDENLQDDFYVGHGYLSEDEDSAINEDADAKKHRFGRQSGEFNKQRTNKNKRSRKQLKVNMYGFCWSEFDVKMNSKLQKNLKSAVSFDYQQVTD
ncbi:hypothetical protein M3Y96_00057300 [Aphelenchoides besseyi]|nr:hypothetical protein M3Y96_00057300 [Aphelenchoides besseyi]